MVVVAGILFLVMVVCFLIYIVVSVVDSFDDSKRDLISDFFRYHKKIKKDSICIHLTFKQFLAFYNVMPERWDAFDYTNIYFIYTNEVGDKFHVVFTTYGEQLKYRIWKKNKVKHDDMLSGARQMNKFIDSVRADSKRAEEEAMCEADELRERISKELEKGENHVSMGR